MAAVAAPTNVRRSNTESPWRRLEVRPYYACRKASPASASIGVPTSINVCHRARSDMTAVGRSRFWTRSVWPATVAVRPAADGRTTQKQSFNGSNEPTLPRVAKDANDRNDPSLNDLVRALQQRLRDGDAERLCGLQVDRELELRWLLDRDIGGLRALENLVDEAGCGTPMPRAG